jgi:hypothetical protein
VPSWQRVRAANLLASNGSAWVDVFKRHNSGTYNNQVRPAVSHVFSRVDKSRRACIWA